MNGHRTSHPARSRPWLGLAGALVAAGLLAGACGSSGSHSSAPPTSPATSAATTLPASTTAAPTTTAAPAPTTTVPPATTTTTSLPITGNGACPSAALSVRLGAANGAAGTFYYPVVVRNEGSLACNVGGYFGVSVWDPAGQLLSADDQRQAKAPDGSTVHQVTLAPGGYASFSIGLVDATCTQSSPHIGAFHFIPPNDTTFDQVSISRNLRYCGDGIRVFLVVAGRSAE